MRAPFGRRQHRYAVPVAVAVALVVHVSVLGTVQALDLSLTATPFKIAPHDKAAKQDDELATNCRFDVLLATGARATECLAPWHDPDQCIGDVPANYYIDLSSCFGRKHDKDDDKPQQV